MSKPKIYPSKRPICRICNAGKGRLKGLRQGRKWYSNVCARCHLMQSLKNSEESEGTVKAPAKNTKQRSTIVRMRDSGKSFQEIAEKLGLSRQRVYTLFQKEDAARRHSSASKSKPKEVVHDGHENVI